MTSRTVALTGGSGYVGALLARGFGDAGYDVTLLSRRRDSANTSDRYFDLSVPPEEGLLDGVDTLVHVAWSLGSGNENDVWNENVVGSRRLVECARKCGVRRIVFISSMSAYAGTRQTYGLMKLSVERTILDAHHVVVRPGLVYGPHAQGMAGTLRKVAALPLWPSFRGSSLFLAHCDDLTHAVVKIASDDRFAGHAVGAAHSSPVPLHEVLAALSTQDRKRVSLPLPAHAIMMSLAIAERAGVKLPFRSDSLLGLVKPPPPPTGQDLLVEAEITFRPLART